MKPSRLPAAALLSALTLVALFMIVWTPLARVTADSATQQDATTETRSVTGTIASIDKTSFTLTLASAIEIREKSTPQEPAKSITFTIDKNTTVDGKLRVGALADVTYREHNGNNLALNVRVDPAQN
jgi:hypothetical protein